MKGMRDSHKQLPVQSECTTTTIATTMTATTTGGTNDDVLFIQFNFLIMKWNNAICVVYVQCVSQTVPFLLLLPPPFDIYAVIVTGKRM